MSFAFAIPMAVVAVWMLACGWAGYLRRPLRFFLLLVVGQIGSVVWATLSMQADPLGKAALGAHFSIVLCGICGFVGGWMISRLTQQLRETRLDKTEV